MASGLMCLTGPTAFKVRAYSAVAFSLIRAKLITHNAHEHATIVSAARKKRSERRGEQIIPKVGDEDVKVLSHETVARCDVLHESELAHWLSARASGAAVRSDRGTA
jgi:hypothetical protein